LGVPLAGADDDVALPPLELPQPVTSAMSPTAATAANSGTTHLT